MCNIKSRILGFISFLVKMLPDEEHAHFGLTSLCSLCCLIDSSSLRLSSRCAFASSASSSATRPLRVAECSRLCANSLLVRSSSSWSSDTRLPSSWASMEPLGSLCKVKRQMSRYKVLLHKMDWVNIYNTLHTDVHGWRVLEVVVELIKSDDLDKKKFGIMHIGVGCVRLGCHVVLMLFLFSSQLKVQLIPGP